MPAPGVEPQVPADLDHPRFMTVGSESSKFEATCCKFDHEEHAERNESTRSPDLDREEVGSGDHIPVGFEELTPRRSLASLRSGVDFILFQDVADSGAPDAMTNVVECPLDSCVSPSAILPCHADDQVGDDLHDPRSAGGSPLVRPLLGDELSVPTKDGVGGDERRDLGQHPSSDRLTAHGKPSALRARQPESLAPELLLQDTIHFPEIVDDRVLLARDPTGHGGYEDLPDRSRSETDRQLPT